MSILAGENNSKPWIGAVVVMLTAGVLYFLTAARDIVVGDTAESLQEEIDGNEPFFEDYHPPNPDSVRFDKFENDIILMYAWPVFRIGNDCLSGGLRDEARKWYARAVAINPNFSKAREALARLEH